MLKSVLVISYFFPPVGGAGVQRVTKFVKHLPSQGWQPIVLTALNPSVPVFDETLLADIPESVEVNRAKTLEPGYTLKKAVSASSEGTKNGISVRSALKGLIRKIASILLQPDPQILWFPAAIRAAGKIIKERRPDLIFVSAPPFSSLLVGAWLARKYELPLIVDYRDEWDISNSVWENKGFSSLSMSIQQRMQSYVIKSSKAIIATTKMSIEELENKAELLNSSLQTHCIYNGYDADDFGPLENAALPEKQNEKYVLSYVGTLWNLTSIQPIVDALHLLIKDSPELAAALELQIAGRRTAEQQEFIDSLRTTPIDVKLHDYMDHTSAIRLMQQSNGLLLLLSDYEFAGRVVPGKLFEYFATANSIMAVTPRGEVWDLLKSYPMAFIAEPNDTQKIAELIKTCLMNYLDGESPKSIEFNAGDYERQALTRKLVSVFESIAETDDSGVS